MLQFLKKFLTVLLPLLLALIVETAVGYHYSSDVRKTFPLVVYLGFTVYAIYSFLFSLVDLIQPMSRRYTLLMSGSLAFILAIRGTTFYTRRNWFPVISEQQRLFLKDIIYSDFGILILFGVFLAMHFVIVLWARSRRLSPGARSPRV